MIILKTIAGIENNLFYQLWTHRTEHVTWYMMDGSVMEFNLADSKTPLPSWRSLAMINNHA